jgi:hypothetical protein
MAPPYTEGVHFSGMQRVFLSPKLGDAIPPQLKIIVENLARDADSLRGRDQSRWNHIASPLRHPDESRDPEIPSKNQNFEYDRIEAWFPTGVGITKEKRQAATSCCPKENARS